MNSQPFQAAIQKISPTRIFRIKEQGYLRGFTDEEISVHAVGNRFAFQLCTVLFTTGLVLTSIPVLSIAAVIASLTVILPYHPFDYLYNHLVRHRIDRPTLPSRSIQAKFSCGVASIWLGAIIYAFYHALFTVGYALGGVLFAVALLVSTVDLCIPSRIFNWIFRR